MAYRSQPHRRRGLFGGRAPRCYGRGAGRPAWAAGLAHQGSREQLRGAAPAPDLIKRYSNELNVTARTPPTFLVHAADDTTVAVGNSMRFAEALQAQHVAVELLVYPAGGHG